MVLAAGVVIMRMRMILPAVESVMMVKVMSADRTHFMVSARGAMKRKKRVLLSVQRVMFCRLVWVY